jgi:hypothetical protein
MPKELLPSLSISKTRRYATLRNYKKVSGKGGCHLLAICHCRVALLVHFGALDMLQ